MQAHTSRGGRSIYCRPKQFRMMDELPYGKYVCEGSYVLHNRFYEPLFRVFADGACVACDPKERIRFNTQEWFYDDTKPPWGSKVVLARCAAALEATHNPQE